MCNSGCNIRGDIFEVLETGGELVGGLGEGGGDVFVGVGAAGVAEEVADGGDETGACFFAGTGDLFVRLVAVLLGADRAGSASTGTGATSTGAGSRLFDIGLLRGVCRGCGGCGSFCLGCLLSGRTLGLQVGLCGLLSRVGIGGFARGEEDFVLFAGVVVGDGMIVVIRPDFV